ncbi:MAG: hypothetical protein IJX98_01225 [Clostridia bacterium]|nr:hypothetical protein [Clostridia bacterium]
MKKIQKLGAVALAAICCAGVFAFPACSKQGEQVDETKTQLHVGTFSGGVGYSWLENVEKRFEQDYANVSFEPGKTGVQVWIDPQSSYSGIALSQTMKTNQNAVFFVEQVYYTQMAKSGNLLEITDIVQSTDREGGSLESNILDWQLDELKVNGKYYALPHYQSFTGVVYDVDLFEKEALYLSADPDNGNGGFVWDREEERSLGPDGKTGVDPETGYDYSADDGFPATYDELKALFYYMEDEKDITPFIFPGQHKTYLARLFKGVAEAYNGDLGMRVQATFDSNGKQLDIVTGFDNNGDPIIEQKVITPETGYLVRQLAGNYYALDIVEHVLDNEDYYTKSSRQGSSSQTDAEEEYIYSSLEGEPIAFLLEGSYWESEAREKFTQSVMDIGAKAENRNFAFFPFPQGGNGTTMTDSASAYSFINARIKDDTNLVNTAKEFLAYCYQEQELVEFTKETGVSIGVQYELGDVYNELTNFQQSCWDSSRGMGYSALVSSNPTYTTSQAKFALLSNSNYYDVVIDSEPYKTMYAAMKENGKTAAQYFQAMWIDSGTWTGTYYKQ